MFPLGLPGGPILRFLTAQQRVPASPSPIDPERPFGLVVQGSGGPRLAAVNPAAEACGVAIGDSLADARAKAGFLHVRDIDAEADVAALQRLSLWATRYTPNVAPFDEDN